MWVYLLRNKTEVESTFLNFIALIKQQFGKVIKSVLSDNDTEFNHLRNYFVEMELFLNLLMLELLNKMGE